MSTTVQATAIRLEPLGAHPDSVVTNRDAAAQRQPSSEADQTPVSADDDIPDGGSGWVVLAGCAVVSFWFTGTSYSWGVIQVALVTDGVGSPSTLAFVGSLSTGLISIMAIINARLIQRLGARRTGLLGVSLLGLSDLTSSTAVGNLAGLFFTSGVLLGLGLSLCFMTVSVTPAQYFRRKRGLANGIVFASGGLGGAVTSYGLDAFIQRVGAAWAYRILGIATIATGLPAAWLIQERVPIRTAGFIEWRLFRDPGFAVIFAVGAIGTFPLFVAPFFIPLYSKSMGLSSSTGAGLLAGFNFASALGRILCGYLCDLMGPLNTLFLSLLLTAISMLSIWPASTTLAPLVAFVVVNGASNGGFFATMPTVVGNIFGSARVSVAMGMIVTGWFGGYLMGAPIAGFLLDAYGGADNGLEAYRPAMYYAGALAMGASGLVALVRLQQSRAIWAKH